MAGRSDGTLFTLSDGSRDLRGDIDVIAKIEAYGWIEQGNAGVFKEERNENGEENDQNIGRDVETLEVPKCQDVDPGEVFEFPLENVLTVVFYVFFCLRAEVIDVDEETDVVKDQHDENGWHKRHQVQSTPAQRCKREEDKAQKTKNISHP